MYMMECGCGIPKVRLMGSLNDWENIRDRALELKKYDLEFWIDAILPILNKFIAAYKGE